MGGLVKGAPPPPPPGLTPPAHPAPQVFMWEEGVLKRAYHHYQSVTDGVVC